MTDDALTRATETYVDSIFGKGSGEKHVRFLERIENDALREMIHRYHTLEADTSELSLVENYLIGMCVLCANKNYDTAAMFAKTLLVLGVSEKKLLAAIARLSMWIGGLPAAEASFVIQRAIREYRRDPEAALRVWFPEPREP
ncbi:MAG: hypothetical protein ACOY0T_00560 [Myxococcota bacterium]